MSDLVLLHHNEPMTTSEAIAHGVGMEHKTIIQLLRKYLADLSEWGEVAFQMRLNPQGSPTEYAWLNEGQSMFLMTLMRNNPVVVAFKKALVNAFLEMRDRLRAVADRPPAVLTRDPSHAADLAVAADRTFRSFMRAGRTAGLPLSAALRIANRQTIERTGMDMLAELDVDPDAAGPAPVANSYLTPIAAFGRAWLAGELPVPACLCHSADLYTAYCRWCLENNHPAAPSNLFHPELRRSGLGIEKTSVQFALGGQPASTVRATIPPGFMDGVRTGEKGMHYATSIARFAQALKDWR